MRKLGKIILTIVITGLLLIVAVAYFLTAMILAAESVMTAKIIGIILMGVVIFVGGAIIYNMIERIKEIKGGEEDDISKY
ncbi:hypothetical protein [Clostridium culturomicium]|uniref:hypothetical protein n=1 Tax=Clostridium culturomicium TaxID=1499683 RepID=UPI00069420A8|nr:hypothetical protein [Clostridium culturomicium]